MQLNVFHTLHSWHELLTHSPTYRIFPHGSSQFAGCVLLQSLFVYVCHLITQASVLHCLLPNPASIQLFQKMLSGRMTNVNCRTAVARLTRNVGIEY